MGREGIKKMSKWKFSGIPLRNIKKNKVDMCNCMLYEVFY